MKTLTAEDIHLDVELHGGNVYQRFVRYEEAVEAVLGAADDQSEADAMKCAATEGPLKDRIRELEGDLSNARHDLQAVHELHERLRQAEAQRDEAWKRIDELDAERRRDGLDGQAALDEAGNRIRELEDQVAALWAALHLAWAAPMDECEAATEEQWQQIGVALDDTAAAAQAHDARVRAEGWREGLRQAVAFLREEANRREPHAEADALGTAAEDLRVRAEKLGVG